MYRLIFVYLGNLRSEIGRIYYIKNKIGNKLTFRARDGRLLN